MNTRPVHSFLITVVVAGLGLMPGGRASAQTFTVLHTFSARSDAGTNGDGAFPEAGLTSDGNTLYGAAFLGGSLGFGTVYAVNTDGSGFTTLSSFGGAIRSGAYGVEPVGGLVLSGNTLCGTAGGGGGSQPNGTVFKINTDGTGMTTVHVFSPLSVQVTGTNSDGAFPYAGLIRSGDTLYGTAGVGGTNGKGTVFAVNTDGSGFTTLHDFTADTATNALGIQTNSDGAFPYAGLVVSGNTLYGTAEEGGSSGFGTVYAVNTDGSGFTTLHSFNSISDGGPPDGGLVVSGDTLYGTTSDPSTVFSINTNGANFVTLYYFTDGGEDGGYVTNVDGAFPAASLILSGDTLYGTTEQGGAFGSGTLFAVNTDGSGFTTLHSFALLVGKVGFNGTNSDGAWPADGLLLLGNTLYGTASEGGANGWGTVFALTLPGGGGSTNCTFSINPTNAVFGAAGGSDSASVTASNGCAWTAVSNDSFITITSGTNGTGNGTVNYTVAANTSTNDLTGTMTIAGQTYTVTEAGATLVTYSFSTPVQTLKTKFDKKTGVTTTNSTITVDLVVKNTGTAETTKSSVLLWLEQGSAFSPGVGPTHLTETVKPLKEDQSDTIKIKTKKLTGDFAGTFIFATDADNNVLASVEVPSD